MSHDLRSPLTAIRAATDGLSTASLALDEGDRCATCDDRRRGQAPRPASREPPRPLAPGSRRCEPAARSGRSRTSSAARSATGVSAERVKGFARRRATPIRVDATQIERVLANLLENALKFSSPSDPRGFRSEVTIPCSSASSTSAWASTQTTEKGCSSRSSAARPVAPARAPSGLAIARGFAHANDSERHEPAHLGRNCRPFCLAADARRALERPSRPRRRRRAADRPRPADDLRGADHEVDTASTGDAALTQAAVRTPEAVILDLVPPTRAAWTSAASCATGRRSRS